MIDELDLKMHRCLETKIKFWVYSGTSPLRHLYLRDTSIQWLQNLVSGECSHSFCICYVTSIEGTPLFRGKGHFFRVLKPRWNLQSGNTLALKKRLTSKIFGKFKCTLTTMATTFNTWTTSTKIDVLPHLKDSTHNITEVS